MSTISVRTHFAAGHRILGLKGAGAKCRNVHGHTFHVIWTFKQGARDHDLEFGELKAALRTMIKDVFDHGFICDKADEIKSYLKASNLKLYQLNGPPTTELIAEEIAFITMRLFPKATLLTVELQEGPENTATWTKPYEEKPTVVEDWHGKAIASVRPNT